LTSNRVGHNINCVVFIYAQKFLYSSGHQPQFLIFFDISTQKLEYVLELVVNYLSERKLNHPITKHLIVNLTPAPVQRRQISMADDDEGLEALAELEKEASEFNKVEKISATYTTEIFLLTRDISSQDAEIDRILKAFRLDA
jgi:hypothetical protein